MKGRTDMIEWIGQELPTPSRQSREASHPSQEGMLRKVPSIKRGFRGVSFLPHPSPLPDGEGTVGANNQSPLLALVAIIAVGIAIVACGDRDAALARKTLGEAIERLAPDYKIYLLNIDASRLPKYLTARSRSRLGLPIHSITTTDDILTILHQPELKKGIAVISDLDAKQTASLKRLRKAFPGANHQYIEHKGTRYYQALLIPRAIFNNQHGVSLAARSAIKSETLHDTLPTWAFSPGDYKSAEDEMLAIVARADILIPADGNYSFVIRGAGSSEVNIAGSRILIKSESMNERIIKLSLKKGFYSMIWEYLGAPSTELFDIQWATNGSRIEVIEPYLLFCTEIRL